MFTVRMLGFDRHVLRSARKGGAEDVTAPVGDVGGCLHDPDVSQRPSSDMPRDPLVPLVSDQNSPNETRPFCCTPGAASADAGIDSRAALATVNARAPRATEGVEDRLRTVGIGIISGFLVRGGSWTRYSVPSVAHEAPIRPDVGKKALPGIDDTLGR
jgi:hypothetical protein